MSEQTPATRSGTTAASEATRHGQAVSGRHTAAGDRNTRYAGGISLAAALGVTLLSVAGEQALRSR
jgi:hypothetical protein